MGRRARRATLEPPEAPVTRSSPVLIAALALAGCVPTGLPGQAPADAVLATVDELFAAMAAGDAGRAAAVLLPEGQWVSVRPGDDGSDVVVVTPHRDVLVRLAEGRERWLERYWDPEVMIHGPVAVVWTAYDFYRDGEFSHCGMEAFTLVRAADGWRIAGATYTVEVDGCPPSPLGPPAER
jgi:hypothetical protein